MNAVGFVAETDRDRVLASLRHQLEYVSARSPLYRRLFAEHGVGLSALRRIDDVVRFPLTTKPMLRESQRAAPPLGGHSVVPMSDVVRVHASTGTTGTPSWVGVTRRDAEVWTDAIVAALRTQGLTPRDVVLHGAGLTTFVGGLPIRDGVERIGATMVPIGTGAPAKALLALETLGVTALHATPSYARYFAECLREAGHDPREFGLRKLIVGGEPGGGEPEFREHLEREWNARVSEGLGNADMVPIIFAEPPDAGGMRLTAGEHVLVELIDPDSGDPVTPEPGAAGELVYTALDRQCCPLVRFATRDRVRVVGRDHDGAPLIRCAGRTDDMLIVLGVNVFPSAVRDVVQSLHPRTSGEMRIVLDSVGPGIEPPLRVEAEWGSRPGDRADLRREVEERIRARLSVPASVRLVPPGRLTRSETKTSLTRTTTGVSGGTVGDPPADGRFPRSDGRFPRRDGRFPRRDGRFPRSDGRSL